jgi:replicative DNA helicase
MSQARDKVCHGRLPAKNPCRAEARKATYEVGEVSGALKALAVRTKAAFLTLAQLNRESEKDKGRAPRLSDLADSAQIERDADTVGLLHRNRGEQGDDRATLIISKQRDGELGGVQLVFNGQFCRFENPPLPPLNE